MKKTINKIYVSPLRLFVSVTRGEKYHDIERTYKISPASYVRAQAAQEKIERAK